MARIWAALALCAVVPVPAAAQDMPLSQILIDGEGWKKVDAPGPRPKEANIQGLGTPVGRFALSPDRSTVYECNLNARTIDAYQLTPGQPRMTPIAPYCPLRTKRGEKSIDVTGLLVDREGRIYAATSLGVQVFDPTGRLCGVMIAPPGKSEWVAFEGDKLVLWVGDTKYARKLRTEGVR